MKKQPWSEEQKCRELKNYFQAAGQRDRARRTKSTGSRTGNTQQDTAGERGREHRARQRNEERKKNNPANRKGTRQN